MKKTFVLIAIAFTFLYPTIVGFSNYYLTLFVMMAIYIIASLGLNLLVGFGGLVSVGQAGFLMIGAYGVAILSTKFNYPLIVALPLTALITAAIGFVIGLSAVRLKGHFLAVVTLGFGISVPQIMLYWSDLTGGYSGLSVAKPVLPFHIYFIVVIVMLLIIFLIYNVINSSLGRAFIAIRDSDIAAKSMGINTTFYKLLIFTISSFITGLAGGLYAYWFGFVSPNDFSLATSFLLLAMIVVGGIASIPGSIIGAILLSLVPHYTDQFVGVTNLIIGGLMVVIILVRPNGLASINLQFLSVKNKKKAKITEGGVNNVEIR